MLVAETQGADVPKRTDGRLTCGDGGFVETEQDIQGMLLGRVDVMPHQTESAQARAQVAAIGKIRSLIGGFAEAERMRPVRLPDDRIDSELGALRDAVVEAASASANRVQLCFALMRTGELRLWYDDVPALPVGSLNTLAEQAYFFIKDVVHAHQHHEPTSDQITPLVVGRRGQKSDDMAWRRETLWSLSREVELLNRGRGLMSQRRSLGLIAYAEAFQRYLMGHVRDTEHPARFRIAPSVHTYDFAHLKDSIKVEVDVQSQSRAQVAQRNIAVSASVLAASSLATALVSAHNTYANAANRAGGAAEVLAGIYIPTWVRGFFTNPFEFGAAVGLIVAFLIAYGFADGESGLFNTMQRIVSQYTRAISVDVTKSDRAQVNVDTAMLLVLAALLFAIGVVPLLITLSIIGES